jgi:hypothetical protein
MFMTYSKEEQKKNRAALVAALRSGEHAQIRDRLSDGVGFCCLGLACLISGLGRYLRHEDSFGFFIDKGLAGVTYLPEEVSDYFGFSNHCGTFKRNGELTNLASLNDDGFTFEQLADIIESEPEGLCV